MVRQKGDGAYDGDTSDLKASGQVLLDFIDKARAKYSTDASKVYLVGFSQGAMMSYEVALRHPEAVGGIAAMGGRVLSVLRAELTPMSRAGHWRCSSAMARQTRSFPTTMAPRPTVS